MIQTIYRAMYGTTPFQQPVETEAERQKRAVKVLGGMKIHNSHIKQVQIGEDLIDVPKIQYVHLLEGQVKELRQKLRNAESRMNRLESQHSRMASDMEYLRRDLAGKVNLR